MITDTMSTDDRKSTKSDIAGLNDSGSSPFQASYLLHAHKRCIGKLD